MIATGDSRLRTLAGQRLFRRLPSKPRGRASLAAHGLEHVPVSRQRGADFLRFCGAAPAGTSRSRARQGHRETGKSTNDGVAQLGAGVGDTRHAMAGPFGAAASPGGWPAGRCGLWPTEPPERAAIVGSEPRSAKLCDRASPRQPAAPEARRQVSGHDALLLVARGSQKISRGRMRLSYRDWPDKLLSV